MVLNAVLDSHGIILWVNVYVSVSFCISFFSIYKNLFIRQLLVFSLQPVLLATLDPIVNYRADIHRMDICVSQHVTVWSHTVITSTVAEILKMV